MSRPRYDWWGYVKGMIRRYLSSYSPKPGDRVYFQRVGGAMLVMGSVI